MNNSNKLTPWTNADKINWFNEQTIKRSYAKEVIPAIEALKMSFEVVQYGALSIDPAKYPLFLIKSKNIDQKKKTILITGGVHGYETSGVHGALAFMKDAASKYTGEFNIICAPCVSPWAYETINRWNNLAIDPNRSFYDNSPSEECKFFLQAMHLLNLKIFAHFDLHETTDTDNSVFRPALEKRDGILQEVWDIPDGFYLVGDTENPQKEFQKAVIDSVKKVTHIAPADKDEMIIGVPIEQFGVINYELKKLSLCGGCMNPEYSTTTEVYPDSPKVTPQECVEAQAAAVVGGIDFLINAENFKTVKRVYEIINQNDFANLDEVFDAQVERVEPAGFPMSGTYRGLQDIKAHFSKARATWAEGTCTPVELIPVGNKVVALIHVYVRLKDKSDWIDALIADAFALRSGRVVQMLTFASSEEALSWARSN